jgi:hypothetical protein
MYVVSDIHECYLPPSVSIDHYFYTLHKYMACLAKSLTSHIYCCGQEAKAQWSATLENEQWDLVALQDARFNGQEEDLASCALSTVCRV